MKLIDLSGLRVGHLVVLRRTGRTAFRHPLWLCLCDCGAETNVHGLNLRSARSRSCGCATGELSRATKRAKRKISPREIARAAGEKFYYLNTPCNHGHGGPRYVSTGCCVACRQVIFKNYYDKNKDDLISYFKRWSRENRNYMREYSRNWYQENNAKARARSRMLYADNPQKFIERVKRYAESNPEKISAIRANRQARERGAEGSHTPEDLAEIMRLQRGRCAYCAISFKLKTPSVDHIKAVSRGGSNDRRNLQLVCRRCNSQKSNRDPIEFAQARGGLL